MVYAQDSRKRHNWGVDGYDFPRFNAHQDKVRTHKIPGGKKKNFLDDEVKQKSFIPPADYNVAGSLINPKKQSNLSKGKRLTLPDEIALLNKKEQRPGPGTYEPKNHTRLLGCFNLQGEKTSFVEEAKYLGLQTPHQYDAKYHLVQEKPLSLKLIPPKEKPSEQYKIKKNDSPSPVSYDAVKSYEATQMDKPRFFIPKSKDLKLTDIAVKQKSFVPGVGTYNFEKSLDKITKGVSKGWK